MPTPFNHHYIACHLFFYSVVLISLLLLILTAASFIFLYFSHIFSAMASEIENSLFPNPNGLDSTAQGALWFGALSFGLFSVIYYLSKYLYQWTGNTRLYLVLNLSILMSLVSSLSYLSQAFGLGHSLVAGRHIFYARYIDYFLTFPMIVTMFAAYAMSNIAETVFAAAFSALLAAIMLSTSFVTTDHSYLLLLLLLTIYGAVIRILYSSMIFDIKSKLAIHSQIILFTIPTLISAYYLTSIVFWLLGEMLQFMPTCLHVAILVLIDVIAKNSITLLILLQTSDTLTLEEETKMRERHVLSNLPPRYGSTAAQAGRILTTEAFLTGFGATTIPALSFEAGERKANEGPKIEEMENEEDYEATEPLQRRATDYQQYEPRFRQAAPDVVRSVSAPENPSLPLFTVSKFKNVFPEF
jgi:bacteriorhodopsin